MALTLDSLPDALRPAMAQVLERLVAQLQPEGLWLFGSWALRSQSARSDIDLLIKGFEGVPVLQAYDEALEAIGDSTFWRSVKAEAKPLVVGSEFP